MNAALKSITHGLCLHGMPIVVLVERDIDGVVMRQFGELTN